MTLQVGRIVRFNARGDPSQSFVARDPADPADALTTAIDDWLFGFIVPAVTLLLLVLIFAMAIGGVA